MTGAKIAAITNTPEMTSPAMSMPRCTPMLCLRWLTIGSRWNSVGLVARVVDMSVPHPRVAERGDDVDDEVGQGDDDGEQDDDALHGHEVASAEILRELESESAPLERRLGQHGPAEQQRDLQSDHRHDGNQRRLVGVLAHEPELADAPGSRRV